MIHIRNISEADAERFLKLGMQLDQETTFMLLEPGERTTTVRQQTERIGSMLASGNSMIFVAEEDGTLIGFLGAQGGAFRRTRHKVHIAVGILQTRIGAGVGTALFAEMEKWAHESGICRLELTVMAHNERGVALYKKVGFEVEGVAKSSMFVDGQYIDEYYMAKVLEVENNLCTN